MQSDRGTSRKRWLRTLVVGAVAALAWVGVVMMAILFYEPVVESGRNRREWEMLGFAAAFFVGGTMSALAALALYGRGRWALVMVVGVLLLLPLPVGLQWRLLAISLPVNPSFWPDMLECLRAGAVLGALPGLLVAVIVAALVRCTRRRLSWRVGLAFAIGLFAVIQWILPPVVTLVADVAADLRWRWFYTYPADAIFGASVGGSIGALAGAIVGTLVAHILHAGQESKTTPPTLARPSDA